MVLTAAQLTAFFETPAQMGLSNRTRVYLQSEGIIEPADLIDFAGKDAWTPILDNCRRPPQVLGPGVGAPLVNQ